jgi:hypothetical protein
MLSADGVDGGEIGDLRQKAVALTNLSVLGLASFRIASTFFALSRLGLDAFGMVQVAGATWSWPDVKINSAASCDSRDGSGCHILRCIREINHTNVLH